MLNFLFEHLIGDAGERGGYICNLCALRVNATGQHDLYNNNMLFVCFFARVHGDDNMHVMKKTKKSVLLIVRVYVQ